MGINITAKTDYSYLFSSLNYNNKNSSDNALMGINLSDYASIKNGSYGKLLKAYYTEVPSEGTETLSKPSAYKEYGKYNSLEMEEEKKALESTQVKAKELSNSATALMERGSKSVFKNEDMDEVYTAVSDMVKDYNSLLEEADNVGTTEVTKTVEKLSDVMEGYEEQLKGFGITTGEDNKLSIDKDTFIKADFQKAKELFNGQSSLSYLVATRATSLANTAYSESNSASLYNINGGYASWTGGSFFNGIV